MKNDEAIRIINQHCITGDYDEITGHGTFILCLIRQTREGACICDMLGYLYFKDIQTFGAVCEVHNKP